MVKIIKLNEEKIPEIKDIFLSHKIIVMDSYIIELLRDDTVLINEINRSSKFDCFLIRDVLDKLGKKLLNKSWPRFDHSDAEKTLFLIKLFDEIKKEKDISTSVLTKIEFVN